MTNPPIPNQVRAHAPALSGQLALILADLAPPDQCPTENRQALISRLQRLR